MKTIFLIILVAIGAILSAQTTVWENPLPIVLGDNIEVQQKSIRTPDGNTIFFWSETELDGRIMYATKLNEMGEYLWPEEKKIVLEHVPAFWLEEIIAISDNNYVLHFSHTDYKNGPYDHIFNIMDQNGNMFWTDPFSLYDHDEELYPVSLFESTTTGFNILCHNHENDETKIIYIDLLGSIFEVNVSANAYADLSTFHVILHNNSYYMLFVYNGDLIYANLDSNYEIVQSATIPLNNSICTNDEISIYPYNNDFFIIHELDHLVCRITESGDLIWLNSWLNGRSVDNSRLGITEDGKIYITAIGYDEIHFLVINEDGEIEVDQPILQAENSINAFKVSFNGNDKINTIIGDYEDGTYYYSAQTVDLNGNMIYPIEGQPLDISPDSNDLTMISYPDKFSTFYLYTDEESKTHLCINTFNETGAQIIPENQMTLESSYVSLSWNSNSRYIPGEDCVMVAYVTNRGGYWNGEVYIQKVNQAGELLLEEGGRHLNTYYTHEDVRKIFIDEEGFVYVVYEFTDGISYLKCDVYDSNGAFVTTHTLDSNVNNYVNVFHESTETGTIVGWIKNSIVKVHKINGNETVWDDPISFGFPTHIGLSAYVTDNYLYCYYYQSSGYVQLLYRFEDNGSISPGWLNGFPLNSIENLEWIARRQQYEDNYYFLGKVTDDEYQLLAINEDQQILLGNLNIISSYSDLYVDEYIYLSYGDTLLQTINVQKYNLEGQLLWDNSITNTQYGGMITRSSQNSLSLISSYPENLSFSSFDLDGNVVTPPNGIIIADSRGEKRLKDTHEMDNGQLMVIWSDQCVENILDGDGSQYNAICGQLFDFSPLSNHENTIPSSRNLQLSNYPNPFNPETTISFSIPKDSEIELSVYNIKGQKVKSLIKESFVSGTNSIIWDGCNDSIKPVSSGIYLYKLIVNGKIEAVKKCLLLK